MYIKKRILSLIHRQVLQVMESYDISQGVGEDVVDIDAPV